MVCFMSLLWVLIAGGFVGQAHDSSRQGALRLVEDESVPAVVVRLSEDECLSSDGLGRDCSYRSYSDGDRRSSGSRDVYECADGVDNDYDGLVDWPVDPGCGSADDSGESDTFQRKTLYAYAWDSRTTNLTAIVPMFYYFPFTVGTGNPPPWPQTTPEAAKLALDAYPEGHRVMILFQLGIYQDLITNHPEDACINEDRVLTNISCLWWDNGVANVSTIVDSFFANYSALGGKVDTVIIDFERGFSNFQVGSNLSNPDVVVKWNAIQNDPRTREEIIPLIGFDDLSTVSNFFSGGNNYHIWNAVHVARSVKFLNQAFFDPVKRYYPYVNGSNYEYAYNYPISCPFGLVDVNGHGGYCLEIPSVDLVGPQIFGTHQAPQAYGWLGQITWPGREPGNGTYNLTAFNSFRYSVNQVRAAKLNSDVGLMPWVAFRSYGGDGEDKPIVAMANTDYYQESVMHISLLVPDALILWNPNAPRAENEAFSGMLEEINVLTGFTDKKSLTTSLADWDADYVLSGVHSGGRRVWRFTPQSTIEQRVDSGAVVIQTATTKLTFNSAVIMPSRVSQQGLWIVQDSRVEMPVIEHRF